MRAGVFDGCDLALDAAAAEAAGYQDAIDVAQDFVHVLRGDCLGVDPLDIHRGVLGDAAVL